MTEEGKPHNPGPTPESSPNASGPGPTPDKPQSSDPYAHLKPYERHFMSELMRLQRFLEDIPDGKPLWTP